MIKVGGFKKSTPSDKDYLFDSLSLSPTGTGDYAIKELTPISDQGGLSSCVANATCDALEILLGVEGLPVVQLSRMALYWEARKLDGDPYQDTGTYITTAFKVLTTLGVCPESLFPYDEDKVFVGPPVTALLSGNANKITSYYRIPIGSSAPSKIETAVRANHPVVFGAPVDNAFLDLVGDKTVISPDMNDLAGGHAMIIVGVRSINGHRQFLVRNSWGTGWGNNGHVWLDQTYVNFMDDVWVPTRIAKVV